LNRFRTFANAFGTSLIFTQQGRCSDLNFLQTNWPLVNVVRKCLYIFVSWPHA